MEAIANGKALAISPKYAIMICQEIRGKNVVQATRTLEYAMNEERAIPFTRFGDGVGHRKGIQTSGRFAVKACTAILALLKSAQANAVNKGMGEDLVIAECRANRASAPMRYGRQSRRVAKRAHVVIKLTEATAEKKTAKKTAKKVPAKVATKTATKTPVKSAEKTAPKAEPKSE